MAFCINTSNSSSPFSIARLYPLSFAPLISLCDNHATRNHTYCHECGPRCLESVVRRLFIRLYKAKERNGALCGSQVYIHGGTVLDNTVRCLRLANGSPLGLDPSHVPVQSRGSVHP